MQKTKTFYAVWTTDDEWRGSIKAYCETRRLAEQELKKHADWWCDNSPEPDDHHIRELQMIVE